MPLIDINVIENVFTPDQKAALITGVTEAVVAVEGENMRGVTWVRVLEVKSEDWAIGGQALSTGAVQDMAAGIALYGATGGCQSSTLPRSALT